MGGEKKVTKMLIKVDLQCSKCYKKIKKILCRFDAIRDQVYDEKANTVTITVVCCSPEKIKEKIYCKGLNTILSIEILPDKPKETQKPKDEKPNTKVVVTVQPPAPAPAPAPARAPPQLVCICPGYPAMGCAPGYWPGCPCNHGYGGVPYYGGHGRLPPMCSDGCGRPASACSDGCGRPASACSDGCGRPASACSDGCGRPASVCQGSYFSDENPSGCMVM